MPLKNFYTITLVCMITVYQLFVVIHSSKKKKNQDSSNFGNSFQFLLLYILMNQSWIYCRLMRMMEYIHSSKIRFVIFLTVLLVFRICLSNTRMYESYSIFKNIYLKNVGAKFEKCKIILLLCLEMDEMKENNWENIQKEIKMKKKF